MGVKVAAGHDSELHVCLIELHVCLIDLSNRGLP